MAGPWVEVDRVAECMSGTAKGNGRVAGVADMVETPHEGSRIPGDGGPLDGRSEFATGSVLPYAVTILHVG